MTSGWIIHAAAAIIKHIFNEEAWAIKMVQGGYLEMDTCRHRYGFDRGYVIRYRIAMNRGKHTSEAPPAAMPPTEYHTFSDTVYVRLSVHGKNVLAGYFASRIDAVPHSEIADTVKDGLRAWHRHLTEGSMAIMTLGEMVTVFGDSLMESPPVTESNVFTFDPTHAYDQTDVTPE